MSTKETANNLHEFVTIIEDLSKNTTGYTLLFRGQTNEEYNLEPSIARKIKKTDLTYVYAELDMVTNAISQKPELFCEEKYPINLLVKLQHFGLPTRLLDVTYNALMALYFACEKDFDKDGEVFIFVPENNHLMRMKKFSNVEINLIAGMYRINSALSYNLSDYFEAIKYDYNKVMSFSESQKSHYAKVEYYLQNLITVLSSPTFVSPMFLSERQKHQRGAFILFPNKILPPQKTHEDKCEEYLNHIFAPELVELSKDDKVVQCIIKIPKESKEPILKTLKHFGITKDFVYPENVENISELIKNDATEDLLYKLKVWEAHQEAMQKSNPLKDKITQEK